LKNRAFLLNWVLFSVVFGSFSSVFASSNKLTALIAEVSAAERVPADLVTRIVRVESDGDCAAPDGGVMQVRPVTAREVGVYGDLSDCRNSLTAGARYLRHALFRAHGLWEGAATLYNQGISARPGPSAYSGRVLQRNFSLGRRQRIRKK
jgi:soluble lytic murein transglycosylase-like protein